MHRRSTATYPRVMLQPRATAVLHVVLLLLHCAPLPVRGTLIPAETRHAALPDGERLPPPPQLHVDSASHPPPPPSPRSVEDDCGAWLDAPTREDGRDDYGGRWGGSPQSGAAYMPIATAGLHSVCACAFLTALAPYRIPDGVSWGISRWSALVPRRLHELGAYAGGGRLLEIGANVGADAAALMEALQPALTVLYEPLPDVADLLRRRFGAEIDAGSVAVHAYGVGRDAAGFHIPALGGSNASEGASAFSEMRAAGGTVEEHDMLFVPTVTAVDALNAAAGGGAGDVDVLHMNCEGCEFDVLEALLESGDIARVRLLQFGSHRMSGLVSPVRRYCGIRRGLAATHTQVWGEPWQWERWERRGQ